MASHAMQPGRIQTGRRPARLRCGTFAATLALAGAAPAAASVGINHLSDLAFGTIANVVADATQSESVCAYAGLLGGTYSVTATGSGSGGAFALAGPAGTTLAYDAQWAAAAGRTSGTALTAGTALTGQSAAALDCTLGASTDASLIVTLRADTLGRAVAGSYSGTLTILLAPN